MHSLSLGQIQISRIVGTQAMLSGNGQKRLPKPKLIAASSPYDNAAAMVSTPVITHATSSQPGLPSSRAISADTMKIPVPIMDPATIMVESNSPRLRVSSSLGLLCVCSKGGRIYQAYMNACSDVLE